MAHVATFAGQPPSPKPYGPDGARYMHGRCYYFPPCNHDKSPCRISKKNSHRQNPNVNVSSSSYEPNETIERTQFINQFPVSKKNASFRERVDRLGAQEQE